MPMQLFPELSVGRRARRRCVLAVLVAVLLCVSPSTATRARQGGKDRPVDSRELQIVDCLLPGQVRKLGRGTTYLTPRRPVRTTALDCEIRGGEYVYYDRANYETALKVWLESAKAGDAEAQYYVGEIYSKGLGSEPDFNLAAQWYQNSAQQGYAPAQNQLGFLYEQGLGVEYDPKQAVEWYRRATGLKGEIVSESEIHARRNELEGVKARLEDEERTAQTLQTQRDDAHRELEELRARPDRSAQRVEELEQQLASFRRNLEESQEEINELTTASLQIDLPGPTIEIFDAIRSIRTRETDSPARLAGHVEAPAGLREFLANGEAKDVDRDGFFQFATAGQHEFKLQATDFRGKRAELEYSTVPVEPTRTTHRKKFGNYHALIIGNDDYENLPDLETASADATALKQLLEDRFGFKTTLLLNAGYFEILEALNDLRQNLSKNDNLLIYYAGHGEVDSATRRGYWLPVEAEPENSRYWISSREIGEQLDALPASRVLVIADSCYSGLLTRSPIPAFENDGAAMKSTAGKRSRIALTSGGVKPVLDTGGGGHSIFARALLNKLSETSDVLAGRRLWSSVRERVKFSTRKLAEKQTPEYGPIPHARHESGDFFFVALRG